jgi:hypothetical protein
LHCVRYTTSETTSIHFPHFVTNTFAYKKKKKKKKKKPFFKHLVLEENDSKAGQVYEIGERYKKKSIRVLINNTTQICCMPATPTTRKGERRRKRRRRTPTLTHKMLIHTICEHSQIARQKKMWVEISPGTEPTI